MVNASSASKNIWVAASDGDIDRVKSYVEGGMNPNVKDQNSYTPMHAAASYHHQELLLYLISKGGNINISDGDGETPLYTVESIDMARWMIEHGADPLWKNNDDQTPADYMEDDHPEIAAYLRTFEQSSGGVGAVADDERIDQLAEEHTSRIMEESRRIMAEAERDGTDPDERLRALVENAIAGGLNPATLGGVASDGASAQANGGLADGEDGQDRKRTRTD